MRSSTYFAAFPLWKAFRELSSAGSERLPYKQRVGGSNPSAPTNERRRLRFLKRLFLFSGRGGRCGTRWTVRVGTGRCGRCGSVRVGPVEVDGAGRGGRCGSRWTVRVGVVGAGWVGRCGPGRDEADWAGPASAGRLVRNEAAGGSPGAPRRSSGRTAAVIVLSCARRCGQPTPSIFPCRLLHALLLPRLQHLRYRSSLALFYAAYFSCSSAASARCGSMSSASSVSLGT